VGSTLTCTTTFIFLEGFIFGCSRQHAKLLAFHYPQPISITFSQSISGFSILHLCIQFFQILELKLHQKKQMVPAFHSMSAETTLCVPFVSPNRKPISSSKTVSHSQPQQESLLRNCIREPNKRPSNNLRFLLPQSIPGIWTHIYSFTSHSPNRIIISS
jgi:hypothetical protein